MIVSMNEGELEMELALICAQQVIVLFLLIGAGADGIDAIHSATKKGCCLLLLPSRFVAPSLPHRGSWHGEAVTERGKAAAFLFFYTSGMMFSGATRR